MNILNYTEIAQLQKILINRTLLKTADAETIQSLLTNCGLSKIGSTLAANTPALNLVINLCSKLTATQITIDSSPRSGLAVFLEYLCLIDPNVSDDDKAFLAQIIAKCDAHVSSQHKIATDATPDNKETENASHMQQGKPLTLAELRKHLADFLQTAIDLADSTSQRTFIDQVGFEARLRQQIHFGGVQSQFISLLISTLMNYGTLDDGRDALEAVLETAKGYVSQNHIQRCDELIKELRIFRTHH